MEKKEAALEIVRHYDDLQRYAESVSDECADRYGETESEIMALLFMIFEILGDGKIAENYQSDQKLVKLQEKLAEICFHAEDEVLQILEQDARDLIDNENHFWLLAAVFFLAGGRKITQETAERISRYGRYHGWTQKELMRNITDGMAHRIFQAISDSLGQKKSLQDIKNEVLNEIKKTKRYVKGEIETIVNGIANDVSMAFAAKNKLRLRYDAVLDGRACGECKSLNGKIFENDDPELPYLPRHTRCRCQLEPVLNDDNNTQNLSYKDFFESIPDQEKQIRLGSASFREYKSGRLKISEYMAVPNGAKLSLADIRKRDDRAFKG